MKKIKQVPKCYIKKFRHLGKLTFPLTLKGITDLVESNSHLPLTISILCHDQTVITDLGLISNEGLNRKTDILHLLMLWSSTDNKKDEDEEEKEEEEEEEEEREDRRRNEQKRVAYFIKVDDVRRLLNFRRYKLDLERNPQRNFYCETCFLKFRSEIKKKKHSEACRSEQIISYPAEGDKIKFTHHSRLGKVPVIGFCDFESLLKQCSVGEVKCEKNCELAQCECNVPITEDVELHQPVGFSIVFVDSEDLVFFQEEYAGTDCVKYFYKRLAVYDKVVRNRRQAFQRRCLMRATKEEQRSYFLAKECYLCSLPFDFTFQFRKVADHDHVTGNFLGAAHSLCNLRRQPFKTPVFFHNAQG